MRIMKVFKVLSADFQILMAFQLLGAAYQAICLYCPTTS